MPETKKEIKEVITQVAKEAGLEKEKVEEMIQLLVFGLDKEEYAVELTDAREVVKIPDITLVPNAPEFIQGIFNLRGRIVVVINLEKRFDLKREHEVQPEHVIIAEVGESVFGVVVDKVTEVLRVPVRIIKKAPGLVSTKIQAGYLKGIAVMSEIEEEEEQEVKGKQVPKKVEEVEKGRLLILLDLPKVLAEEELLKLGEEVTKVTKK